MRSACFTFKYGSVAPINFTGIINFEWIFFGSEKKLVIHSVKFNHIRNANVQRLSKGPLYDYFVERAKKACHFE